MPCSLRAVEAKTAYPAVAFEGKKPTTRGGFAFGAGDVRVDYLSANPELSWIESAARYTHLYHLPQDYDVISLGVAGRVAGPGHPQRERAAAQQRQVRRDRGPAVAPVGEPRHVRVQRVPGGRQPHGARVLEQQQRGRARHAAFCATS